MDNKMIPFGKYKGQPVDVLQNDPQYADWIAQQAWAKERFPGIVNIIINKFGESEETPDHNAMQAKFMSRGYCAAAHLALGMWEIEDAENPAWLQAARGGKDVAIERVNCGFKKLSDLISAVAFEVGAIDVSFSSSWVGIACRWSRMAEHEIKVVRHKQSRIELKPVIGDDYPAVLRQMRNNKSNALIYGKYTGTGVPEQTFRSFFSTQSIRVIAEKEISEGFAVREKEKISQIKNAIQKQEEILRSRVTVS